MDTKHEERRAAWRSPLSHWQAGNQEYVTDMEQRLLDSASEVKYIWRLLDVLEADPDYLEKFSHALTIKNTMEATLMGMASHDGKVVELLKWLEVRPRVTGSLPCRKKIINRATSTLRENHKMAQYQPLLERVRAHL